MPTPPKERRIALKILQNEYDSLAERHNKAAPRGGALPVGGGDWMDCFFRMEGVRGALSALGRKVSLPEAIKEGKMVSEIAVRIWNQRREWQVRRWDKTVHNYLDGLYRRIRASAASTLPS